MTTVFALKLKSPLMAVWLYNCQIQLTEPEVVRQHTKVKQFKVSEQQAQEYNHLNQKWPLMHLQCTHSVMLQVKCHLNWMWFSCVSLLLLIPLPSHCLPLSSSSFPPSGVGQQQEAGQAEANRGEPGAPSERGTAEDGVGPTGAYPGGVGPHPYGDWGPYGHERPGQPLEAEAEIPGETSSSLPPSSPQASVYWLPCLIQSTPPNPLPPLTNPFYIMPLSPPPPPPPQPLFHCSLC